MAMTSGLGTLQFLSNAELDQQADAQVLAERDLAVAPSSLAGHVRAFFESAKIAKLDVEQEMLRLIRQSNGEYEASMLAALRSAGMPEDFIRLTSRKERDVEGWLWDVFNSTGERSWDITPDSTPELPPDLEAGIEAHVRQSIMDNPEVQNLILQAQQTGTPIDSAAIIQIARQEAAAMKDEVVRQARQYAEQRCTAMEGAIQDQLDQGGYYDALKACINDLSRLQTCIMKGPILKKKKVLGDWLQTQDGRWLPQVEEKIVPCFERVSPFDWYPVANSNSVHDGAACELEHFNDPSDLHRLIGVPGYRDEVIRQILSDYAGGYKENTPIAPERFLIEKQNSSGLYQTKGIDAISYWGEIPGKLLMDWGIDETVDPTDFYFANIKMVNSLVFRAVINPDPLGRKPFHVTSFIKSNDSQWGTAPGMLAYDIQGFCNNVIRNLARNISESAGPMAEVNEDRLADGESPDRWPGKTFVTTSKGMQQGDVVKYFQASLLAGELWSLFQNAKLELDSIIIPSFGQGSSLTKGGGRTASGLAMIANAESRNLKVSVWNVDNDIQIPCIERLFVFNMLFSADDRLKGALKLKARGVAAQLIKDNQQQRQGEFMTRVMNPLLSPILGTKGLAYLVRKDAENLGLDINQVVPNYQQIEASEPHPVPPQPVDPNAQVAGGAQAAQAAAPASTDAAGVPVAQYSEQPDTHAES
jgi:hypothetical protein